MAGRTARAAVEAGLARWLAGGPVAFAAGQVILRDGNDVRRRAVPVGELDPWARAQEKSIARHLERLYDRLTRPRPPFAGISLDRPRIMGVINVTPDSFSDGGDAYRTEDALACGKRLARA
ncbi:MAG: dihydropteroate synthase, partial [Alphaproteobacteria bacterium]|nr:dihydropteroate synthase [Alphaproteobacteria bacterium]